MKYLLIDASNMFFRSRHVAAKQADQWTKIGFAIHLTMSSVQKAYKDLGGDHVIFCLEGRSWRKDYYPPYKRNRAVARNKMTETELEEDQLFFDAYNDLCNFLKEKSSCSVIQCATAEADDVIARWIALHPDDSHVIISSDSDFHQLLAENVVQFNGVSNELSTIDGVFDDRLNPVKVKKTGEHKQLGAPEWILFEKCMRGDPTDNVFSAYPGVRTKGSKNKVGLLEAYEDRKDKGYKWNNLMLQKWSDHNDVDHRVVDDYERNRVLIDLNAQPDSIKEAVDKAIKTQIKRVPAPQVGMQLLKFCGKYQLLKLSENSSDLVDALKKEYR